MSRIEEDPVWSQVDSDEFDSKFLRNDIPAVANIATLVKRAHLLSVERAGLEERLRNLREDRQHNDYMPGELYRFIQQLRTEVDSLRTEVDELKKSKQEQDERLRNIGRISFDLFSNLAQTVWNPATSTLTYYGPTAHNYAVCSVPLPNDRLSQWKVDIVTLSKPWLFLGIIGKAQGIDKDSFTDTFGRPVQLQKNRVKGQVIRDDSPGDSTPYGWSCNRDTVEIDNYGWPGWQQGDRGLFTYNPFDRSLSLELERTNTHYTIDNIPSTYTAHIFCRLQYTSTVVRLSAAW